MPSFDPASLVGKLTPDGSLQLMEIIGSGSFSVVCRAQDLHTGREYAVKCLFKFNLNPQQLAIQRQEATILSQLPPHPNVIRLEKVIESHNILFLVFPYLPADLFDVIMNASSTREGGISDEAIRDMMLQICSAVKQCHDHGIFHRDIKPENILVETHPSGRHRMKLADFGLATTQTYSNDLGVGSMRYQSPQALRSTSSGKPSADSSSMGGVISATSSRFGNDSNLYNSILGGGRPNTNDPRLSLSPLGYWTKLNDVWALGVVLINLITGRNPWAMAATTDPTYTAFTDYDQDILSREFGLSDDTAAIIRGVFEIDEDSRLSLKELMHAIKSASKFRLKPITDKTHCISTSILVDEDETVPDLAFSSYTPPPDMLTSPTRFSKPVATTNPINIAVPVAPSARGSLKTPKAGIVAARSHQRSWSSDLEEMDWENGLPQFDDSGVVVKELGGSNSGSDDEVVHDDEDSNNSVETTSRTSEELFFTFEPNSVSNNVGIPPSVTSNTSFSTPTSNTSSRSGSGIGTTGLNSLRISTSSLNNNKTTINNIHNEHARKGMAMSLSWIKSWDYSGNTKTNARQ